MAVLDCRQCSEIVQIAVSAAYAAVSLVTTGSTPLQARRRE